MTNFNMTKSQHAIVMAIADRALTFSKTATHRATREITKMDFIMDIKATHCNGCPLKLEALRDAPDFDFVHDVFGINRHLDRETGKLTGHFLPRFAAPKSTSDHPCDSAIAG